MSVPLQREQLRSVQLIQITAFDSAGELALTPMRQLSESLMAAGIRVFIPCAASSEFHSLVADEIVATIGAVRESVGSKPAVLVPIGLQPKYAIEVGKRSLDAGADGALIMPLSFPYISDEGVRDYYLEIMDALQCPTLIYKKDALPSNDLLLELADHPQLIGIKYAVNDMDVFNTVIQKGKDRIDWYCGSAERYSPYYTLAGSPGYTSGLGNICPRLTLAMHTAMANNDWQEAMRLQQLILPIEHYRARSNNSYNVSFLKYAMHHVGLDFGQPRAPFRKLTSAEEHEIDQIMKPIVAAEAELREVAAV